MINTRRCLVKIGKHIDSLIDEMTEDQGREWRSSLWLFVSNFTELTRGNCSNSTDTLSRKMVLVLRRRRAVRRRRTREIRKIRPSTRRNTRRSRRSESRGEARTLTVVNTDQTQM